MLAAYNKGVKARATLLAVLEENMKFLKARKHRKRCASSLMLIHSLFLHNFAILHAVSCVLHISSGKCWFLINCL